MKLMIMLKIYILRIIIVIRISAILKLQIAVNQLKAMQEEYMNSMQSVSFLESMATRVINSMYIALQKKKI